MEAFDVLGDPVRRRILELLAEGERPAGAVSEVVRAEFGISQPAVSHQLRILREAGFATVRADGTRGCTRSIRRRCRPPTPGWTASARHGSSRSTRSKPSSRAADDNGGSR